MPNEIEAKFKVDQFDAVRQRLGELKAAYLGTSLLTDVYYDTPTRDLLGQDRGLRIRHVERLESPSDGDEELDTRAQLTYKSPAGTNERAKIRREIQTHVDSHEAMEEVLGALGVVPTITIQKKRAGYRLGSCIVELDELPIIGRFIEIEAPSVEEIHAAAAELGISAPPSTDHYIKLLTDACDRASKTCLEVTFEACKTCPSA